ncbi:MAG: recombination protein RmuC [Moraxellaceae bacterium]|nr:recombination protein RmuC [Moraxellaceae bacterium]
MSLSLAVLIALLAFAAGVIVALFLRSRPLAALREESHLLRASLQEQAVQQGRQQERLLALTEQEGRGREQRAHLEEQLHDVQRSLQERDRRLAEIEARLRAEQDKLAAQAEFIKTQEQSLKLQFEQLATRIFDEKSKKFSEQNKTGLDGLLNPLREQLKDFREKVENAYGNEARERFALKEQITRLEGLNRQISDDAGNLARALKGDRRPAPGARRHHPPAGESRHHH